ncbi:MAG: uracil-DNA glycosylase [Peptococcaceae bacterium]|nr:uracil-DNA glycosylase [Peptococcaceae bacterium]
MNAAENLEELRRQAEACHKCALRQGCLKVVFGEGIPNKGLMVIGEGPGQDEDRLGRPFVGRAGKLLDLILESGGFSRQTNTYVANIVKCRPPQNRVPLPEEREACLPYLLEQIQLADPRIILLLGATALQGLVDPKAKISASRGQWIQWQGRLLMPTYHPAALLRNPGLKAPVWEDVKLVVDKYRELVDPEHSCGFH